MIAAGIPVKGFQVSQILLTAQCLGTCWCELNANNFLHALDGSTDLFPQKFYGFDAFIRRTAEPITKILREFTILVHPDFLNGFFHDTIISYL